MAEFLFFNQVSTLQIGFDPSAPEFVLTSEESLPVGGSFWGIFETSGGDGHFSIGETLNLVSVDWQGSYAEEEVVEVVFTGVVDIDSDGVPDGLVVSEDFSEYILTDLDPFLDYSPFSTEVVVAPVPVTDGAGGEILPQVATRGSDILYGTAGKDVLKGLGGSDTLIGLSGNDRLLGQSGGDSISGGSGRDVLKGGAGRDILDGGKGGDRLFGGKGTDFFSFAKGDGKDVVKDFNLRDDYFLIGRGAKNLSQLEFIEQGDDVLFKFGNVEVLVENVELADLMRQEHFIF